MGFISDIFKKFFAEKSTPTETVNPVGATTASTGAFTTLSATTQPVVRPQDVVKAEVERVVNSAAVKTPRAKKILAVKASAGSKSKKI